MDVRMVQEIASSPSMSADQGASWLQEWGGSSGYMFWAKQPLNNRLTYFAVQEGYNTPESISAVVDLPVSEVNRSLGKLQAQGLVDVGQVEK